MRDARYLQEGALLADAFGEGGGAGEHGGDLFLVFGTNALGLCALPITAVQAVCAADGPVRKVPLCGGVGSRFLGLVSVRGQVQLLFDLSRPLVTPNGHPQTGPDVLLSGNPCPPPHSSQSQGAAKPASVDHPPEKLRLGFVTRSGTSAPIAADHPSEKLHSATRSGAAAPMAADHASEKLRLGFAIQSDASAPAHSAELLLVAVASDERTLALKVLPPLRLVRPEQVEQTATGGSFPLPQAAGEVVFLFGVDALFAQLEAEVRHG